MRIVRLRLRDFLLPTHLPRTCERAQAVTVVDGRNGAGKTNLLEAIYFGCTGRSSRAANDRPSSSAGAPVARVNLGARGSELRLSGSTH